MRELRWIVMVAVVGAVLAIPTVAIANGGAYIEFDQTHYLPGETAVGWAYVFIPREKQGLLERGPFYAFVLPNGISIREGRPIPDGAIRVGTFSIEPEKSKSFEMSVSFTVPELSGDFYSVAVCNDPCTVLGFREPLSGLISVVQTAREGQLLTERSRLQVRIYGLRRDVRKAGRKGDELQVALDASEQERSRLSSEVNRLDAELAAVIA
ncbi:MAG: hypothetical protein ACT4PO_04565, partial [Actinomycetota bacterium]